MAGQEGFEFGNSHAKYEIFDGFEVVSNGYGRTGISHVIAVKIVVYFLGSKHLLRVGKSFAEGFVGVGNTDSVCSGEHLVFVEVSTDNNVTLQSNYGNCKASCAVGSPVSFANYDWLSSRYRIKKG